ncbi:DUF4209 domain-containing protein [Aliarcobacter butzleri]|uniref:DUF4209 domain-containing protein n=1 Tax=Aliarcobacter butzleri TaxID=28197 RepID=UPI002B24B956|nr:DUF4209 domain-containing protein [Aliarcobacter butzleri]
MSEHRYNLDLEVTLEDFKNSNYKEVLKKASREGLSYYHTVLSCEARDQIEQGNEKLGKIFWLLADISSYMIHPENSQELFSPYVIMQGKRSAVPEDFNESDLIFFENILEACSDFRLKARIADTLWYLKRGFPFVKIAIENYMKLPLDPDNLHVDTKNSFERAIRISISTKQNDLLEVIQNLLIQTFHKSKVEDNFHCNHLNDLLLIANINIDSNLNIIQKLEEFAQAFEDRGDWRTAREYYQSAKQWFKKLSDIHNINRTTTKVAETFVSEAESRKDSQMVAAKFYENAIQEYRSIPNTQRANFNVDSRIEEIYQSMVSSNKLVHGELQKLETEGIDISKLINNSIERIENKNFEEALIIFANITTNPKYESIKNSSKKILESTSISRLFDCTHYSSDGRVIGITKGGLDNSESYNQQLESQMRQQYSIELGLIIQGSVIPAFEQLTKDHAFRKEYLVSLCSNSSIVPRDRSLIWAEGLYFGFERNFLVSTHLLIPQIEHLIRVILKQENIQTTVLDAQGIETEKGLSKLFEEQKLNVLIGMDLLFDLKSLLTDNMGYNLRNNIAHGLSEHGTFRSLESVYLWWLCFKLVVNGSHLISENSEVNNQEEVK